MEKDYSKLCPNLSKFISLADIKNDLAPKGMTSKERPSLTKEKVEQAYLMLLVDPQYLKISYTVGIDVDQVKELHDEMIVLKSSELITTDNYVNLS